ncbi:MAG: DUF2868 domain-containing protein [Planctomycetota bacterium]
MPSRFDRRVWPADLVAAAVRLNQDDRRPRGELNQREARVRAALVDAGPAPVTDHGRVLFWLGELPDVEVDQAGQRVRSAFALVGLLVTLLGVLSGIGLASGAYAYDGSQRINIAVGLGLFVILQSLLLLLTWVAALPRDWLQRLPLADGLQEAIRLASPGRLGLLAARLLPQESREALDQAIGRAGSHQRVFGRVQLWALLQWSQLYALAVNLAAAATLVFLVVFTDLSFGWATTLDVQAEGLHRLVIGISVPWWWLPAAVPSLEMVSQTRFTRGSSFDPMLGRAWWPFMLMAMVVYGLLPRIVTLLIAHRQLGLATRRALLAMPGITGVLRALDAAEASPDANDSMAEPKPVAAKVAELGSHPLVIDWSRAAGSAARASQLLNRSVERLYPAGGSRTLEEDEHQLTEIASTVAAEQGVAVLVKLWEPPVIEVTDYFKQLRRQVGDALAIVVVPIASEPSGAVVSQDPGLVSQWRRRVSAVGDPWLSVADPVGFVEQEADHA